MGIKLECGLKPNFIEIGSVVSEMKWPDRLELHSVHHMTRFVQRTQRATLWLCDLFPEVDRKFVSVPKNRSVAAYSRRVGGTDPCFFFVIFTLF